VRVLTHASFIQDMRERCQRHH